MADVTADQVAPLRRFVRGMTELIGSTDEEAVVLERGRDLLAELIADDAWLAPEYATARSDRYAQYLLHCDPLERFSMVSFVWGPGQRTPVHNHTVWGLVGQLRGSEQSEDYELRDGMPVAVGATQVLTRGEIDAVSPTIGDWHRVTNTSDDVSISIHVYGGNVGALHRSKFDEKAGRCVDFVSGYDNTATPNLWGRPVPTPC
jgi:predicted metal-dependent enzyme (double-stranded beta helix superfamily)